MKTISSLAGMVTLICAVATYATEVSFNLDNILQSTEFSLEDGYVPGSLDGQQGWITLGQPAAIVGSSLLPGAQALQLAQGSDSWAVHLLELDLMQAVQIDIVMELFASTTMQQSSRLSIGDMDIGFILDETGAFACVEYPLEDTTNGTDFPQVIPANPDGSLGWSHIGLTLDFDNNLWNLSINGLTVAGCQSLVGAGAGDLSLMISAGESGPAQVASISVEETLPLDDTGMSDGLGDSGAGGDAGTISATSRQKQSSYTAATTMSSTGDSGNQSASMNSSGNNAQPAFFTIFSPN
jgi:hypothetical protein